MKSIILCGLVSILSMTANAGQYCPNEKITSIMLGSSTGSIIFQTDKSCDTGCKLRESWSPELKDKAYAMMLSAQAQRVGLRLYWEAHSSPCQGTVLEGSSPALMSIDIN